VALAACVADAAGPGARLRVEPPPSTAPVTRALADDPLPLSCRLAMPDGTVRDVSHEARVASPRGVVHGRTCASVRVRRSGLDTLRVHWRGLVGRAVVAVALPPSVAGGPVGEWMQLDSLSGPGTPWAPSARLNSRGQVEVYATVYARVSGSAKGTLQRLVSDDGVRFRWDGVVLRPAVEDCSPWGGGIENVAVVPRADGAGWRMFFAAGANECYGWQVFSAVSADERTWTVEPGIRLDNGGRLDPTEPRANPYWGVGEGMFVHRDGAGWRMIVGGYERTVPGELTFQIVEWRSDDQLRWRYTGPLVTTRDLPAEASGGIASPAVREFAPGVYRMLFVGDDRGRPGARSRVWSAVSRDLHRWQVEGELMGAPGTDLFYVALVGERAVLLRRDAGGEPGLAIATVQMP
jgi:hypothetical protein